ncbi:MAG: 4'-phosphopantetheinyl transferase superfamily protein [Prevotella sp.]|jgi:4'-phosphopantetheinyl transferase|nr:4'-phosphopantetheinyl transferase superfamily protein [Prevotella sp.]
MITNKYNNQKCTIDFIESISSNFETILLIRKRDLSNYEFDNLLSFISQEAQVKIRSFKFYRDAQNSLLSDVLARIEISKRTGVDIRRHRFTKNQYGKPKLLGDERIHFNISHSGECIALGIDSEPLGIDVEEIKPIDMTIAQRFFSADEVDYIYSQKYKNQLYSFYRIWTMKESYVKWDGKGLSIPLSSFSVLKPNSALSVFYHNVFTYPSMVCHVCTTRPETPKRKIIDLFYIFEQAKNL